MNPPPYHLRPNKAVDRFIMIEAIRRLEQFGSLSQYTYYGLGGPYLEDFRILYELCKDLGMVSIEIDKEIFKRQQFHLPCSTVLLNNIDLFDFIDDYDSNGKKSIFWLDYTNLTNRNFECFKLLLNKVAPGSVVKISLRAQAKDYLKDPETFRDTFQDLMPDPNINIPWKSKKYAKLIQDMLQVASQQALPGQLDYMFQPINSFFYSDGTEMLTLSGIICSRIDKAKFRRGFEDWEFANLDWEEPTAIDVPILSTKERLHLQDRLPCSEPTGETLLTALGHSLGRNEERTKTQLKQYSEFHRYYPYFIRAVP